MKNQCIKATGRLSASGYGIKWINGKSFYEHRLAFLKANPMVEIEGRLVHHICQNKACINPKHLMVVTRKEHAIEHGPSGMAKIHKSQTHCINGHPLDHSNKNQRFCIICKRKAANEYAKRNRGKLNVYRKKWRKNEGVREKEAKYLKSWRARQKTICAVSI